MTVVISIVAISGTQEHISAEHAIVGEEISSLRELFGG